jgi:hypothetical protein
MVREAFVYVLQPYSTSIVELLPSPQPMKYGEKPSPFRPDDPITPKVKTFIDKWIARAGSNSDLNLLVAALSDAASTVGLNAVFVQGSATNPPHAWLTLLEG